MANPTTNYSFAMPTNTDLVKDLPADFEIFGQAVDTKIKDLNPETTAGDISYRGSTANAKTRLPIGTANQVLRVNSGATAPEWATVSSGGMTLLSTTTLTGSNTTISSISQDYNELVVYIYDVANNTSNGVFFGRPTNGATGLDVANIGPAQINGDNTVGFLNANGDRLSSDVSGLTRDRTDANNFWEMRLPNYTSTTSYKGYQVIGGYYEVVDGRYEAWFNLGIVRSDSAINALQFIVSGGGSFTSGTVKIYGVK